MGIEDDQHPYSQTSQYQNGLIMDSRGLKIVAVQDGEAINHVV